MMLKRRVWLRYWHALASGHCELYEAGDELMSRGALEGACVLCSTWRRVIMW